MHPSENPRASRPVRPGWSTPAGFPHCSRRSAAEVIPWSADRATGSVEVGEAAGPPRYALLGVRPCDVRAIGILDQVLTGGKHADPVYQGRRDGAFVIAVECTEPGATCCCTSMGGGPGAESGFDLAMTELADAEGHRFVVRAGTPAGAGVLADVPSRAADEATVQRASTAVDEAADHMGRAMPALDLSQLLAGSRESVHGDDVASRCLTCGNCTMVCPTCFCTTTEDVTDLTGDHAERWRVWDSCYSLDFSYLHGGSVRSSGQSRYGSGSATSWAPGTSSSAPPGAWAAAGASPGARPA